MKSFKFHCTEVISLNIKNTTNSIYLNSRELDIKKAYVVFSGRKIKAKTYMDKKLERVRIVFEDRIKGELKLYIDVVGKNNDGMYGFYRSSYIYNGNKRELLTTQFEAADARSAFVCFDEPEFKASFDVSLVIDKKLEAISNMPIKNETFLGEDRKIVEFEKTPKMSSYLLYLAVGNFQVIRTSLEGLELKVITVPGKISMAKMALDFCKKFVDFYQKYFGIKFPLPKIDLIAIPDFSAGAMENWGAITFREVELLGDPNKTSVFIKQRIAEVIAHELAHQWFGDLVTMSWWNDLWLNESFATFMSYKAMDAVFPEWDMKTQYYLDIMAPAFNIDSRKATHPIAVNVDTPAQINSIFDAISYEKGGTVLHMLEKYVGETIFKKGLHNYLKKYEYDNAEGNELWDVIDEVARSSKKKVDVAGFATAWITQPGHPLVDVDIVKDKIKLLQNRFSISGILKGSKTWPIPLDYTIGSDKKVIKKEMKEKEMYLGKYDRPIKLNYNQDYMYRVRYTSSILEDLGTYIRDNKLDSINALGIENDLFILGRSGAIKLDFYLNFVEKYCMNVDYPADRNISEHLGWLLTILYGTNKYEQISKITTNFHKNLIEKVGWDKSKKDTNVVLLLRATSISYLGILGYEKAVSYTNRLYSTLLNGKQIDKDMLGPVLRVIAWNGNEKIFRQIVKMYKKEEFPEAKIKYLLAIGLFRKEKFIKKALEFTLSDYVKLQDLIDIPIVASRDVLGYPIVWEWMKKNWPMLVKKISVGTHMLQKFIDVASLMHSEKERLGYYTFFNLKKNKREDIEKEFREILETIDTNIKFFKINEISNSD